MNTKDHCVACYSEDITSSNFLISGKYPLYHCDDCGLSFYLDLANEENENTSFDEYWSDINQKIYSNPDVINELKQKYLSYFRKITTAPGKKLLDVGSGAGICVNTANQAGFDAMGIEPSSNAVELSKKSYGIKVTNDLLSSNTDLPHDFSVLTLWDVIEHVFDPEELISVCALHLASDGSFILETPDESAFIRKLVRQLSKLSPLLDFRSFIYYRAHRYYFTTTAMTKLLERCGFDDIRFYKEHSMYEKGRLKDQLYRGRHGVKDILARIMLWLLTKLPFLSNKMVVIARKSSS